MGFVLIQLLASGRGSLWRAGGVIMGGDHGHGHGPPYKIPDYKIYKVESVPELMAVQRALAQKGLKDPWLR